MDEKLQTVLSAVNMALGVVGRVAKLPGVSAIPYVNTISGAIDLIQQIAKVGGDVLPVAEKIKATFSKPDVSTDDMAALDAEIAKDRAKLHAPLPPREEGEPD